MSLNPPGPAPDGPKDPLAAPPAATQSQPKPATQAKTTRQTAGHGLKPKLRRCPSKTLPAHPRRAASQDATSVWPAAAADLAAGDGDCGGRAALVAPDRVAPGRQARVNGRVPGLAGHVPRADLRVRAPGTGLVVAADLDLLAVQVGRRVQDQGADAGAELEDHGAWAGRTGGWLGHAALLMTVTGITVTGRPTAPAR